MRRNYHRAMESRRPGKSFDTQTTPSHNKPPQPGFFFPCQTARNQHRTPPCSWPRRAVGLRNAFPGRSIKPFFGIQVRREALAFASLSINPFSNRTLRCDSSRNTAQFLREEMRSWVRSQSLRRWSIIKSYSAESSNLMWPLPRAEKPKENAVSPGINCGEYHVYMRIDIPNSICRSALGEADMATSKQAEADPVTRRVHVITLY